MVEKIKHFLRDLSARLEAKGVWGATARAGGLSSLLLDVKLGPIWKEQFSKSLNGFWIVLCLFSYFCRSIGGRKLMQRGPMMVWWKWLSWERPAKSAPRGIICALEQCHLFERESHTPAFKRLAIARSECMRSMTKLELPKRQSNSSVPSHEQTETRRKEENLREKYENS